MLLHFYLEVTRVKMEEHPLLLDRHQTLIKPGTLRRPGLTLLPSLDQILTPEKKDILM